MDKRKTSTAVVGDTKRQNDEKIKKIKKRKNTIK